MNYAAISLNFDSLSEAYGFPADYVDPSYTNGIARFFELGSKFGFRYSIYVIAKDLEDPDRFERVRQWSKAGHEIGNHSWSHPMNLGTLDRASVREEIRKSHNKISEAIGSSPKGFIAPAWNSSNDVMSELVELGYEYDSSMNSSWMMIPLILKGALNHMGDQRWRYFFARGDWSTFLFTRRRPFFTTGNLLMLPMPTNRWGMSCWHTLGFVLGWKRHFELLKSCLDNNEFFYYLVHPADLLAPTELDSRFRHSLERTHVSLDEKTARLDQCLSIIKKSGREIVTMQELAQKAKQKLEQSC